MIGKAVVTGGVAYHHALTRSGEPLADFDAIDVHELARVDLAAYDIALVLRSTDNDALRARRHQFARFLDNGGVLVVFGEARSDWFPGCRWEAECPEDLLDPVLADHPLFDGIASAEMNWHGSRGPNWCNHGHLVPPVGAKVLVATQRGDAWLYVDRTTTNGVILAATNVDLDTHAFHNNALARELLRRVLAWADDEARSAPERRARSSSTSTSKIAGLFSGARFQQGFYDDHEFGGAFAVVPVEELAGLDLARFPAVWVPRESNQGALVRHRGRLAAYLDGGGTLVSFDEINQPWLRGSDWEQRRVDVETLTLADHPLLAGIRAEQVRWHSHGIFAPPAGAIILIGEEQGGAVLYLDEETYAPGRLLVGTLDPDCHVGYGSDRPRPLLRNILRWVFAGGSMDSARGRFADERELVGSVGRAG